MSILSIVKDFPEQDKISRHYHFKVSVFVAKNIPPRDGAYLAFDLTSTLTFVRKLYNEVSGDFLPHEVLVFPDQHITQLEGQSFMSSILAHANVGQIEELTIITKCPMIVGSFDRTSIRILSREES